MRGWEMIQAFMCSFCSTLIVVERCWMHSLLDGVRLQNNEIGKRLPSLCRTIPIRYSLAPFDDLLGWAKADYSSIREAVDVGYWRCLVL